MRMTDESYAELEKLSKDQLLSFIAFLDDANSLPAVEDMMKRLDVHSRVHHQKNGHTAIWKGCQEGLCIEDHQVLGKIYMEKAA